MAKIRVGIFGTGRGVDLARNFLYHNDCEVVALCDNRPNRLENGVKSMIYLIKVLL
jgi:predicted dehydrogenase